MVRSCFELVNNILNLVSTPCFQAQEEYEVRKLDGSLGMYETRPRCDENGDFVARKCQPGGRYSTQVRLSMQLRFITKNCI